MRQVTSQSKPDPSARQFPLDSPPRQRSRLQAAQRRAAQILPPLPHFFRGVGVAAGLLVLAVIGAWLALPFPRNELEHLPTSILLLDRQGEVLRITCSAEDAFCEPYRLDLANDWIGNAMIAAEDKRFFEHPGIDTLALSRALIDNLTHAHILSGASTISMQVIRLIEPRPRTVLTKLIEMFRATQMERILSKPEILEHYLNRAPFGGNLIGIQAASRRYFGKPVAGLTLAESALLAGLPQSPSRLRPDRRPVRARARRDQVLRRMRACGFIDDRQLINALAQPVSVRPLLAPWRAPHFCDYALATRPGVSARQAGIITTIDGPLQQWAEDLLKRHARMLRQQGVAGGAVVVLDTATGAIRAMVGAPDYDDARNAGQVNGALAPRSPGSTLKPFIFTQALEQGLCTPATMLADVPMHLADYEPENFARIFSGPVSAREALVRSLNIPALKLLQQMGQDSLMDTLRKCGLSTLSQPKSNYGLGIALGGGEVQLLALANAYACLARGGIYRSSHWRADAPDTADARLFSPQAVYMLNDMLSGDERNLALYGHVADVHPPRLAWKTGTSAGFRDAWTLAWNPDFVVGIWLGNPDGKPSPALAGLSAAAPIAGEFFRHLYPQGGAPWYTPPEGLARRPVCARSGQPAQVCCPVGIEDWHIPGISSTRACPVHRLMPFDRITDQRLAPGTLATYHNIEWKLTEYWPPDMEDFLRTNVRPLARRSATAHLEPPQPGLTATSSSRFSIISPITGTTYHYLSDAQGVDQQIPLKAVADASARRLFWFANGRLVGDGEPGTPLYLPLRPGMMTLACCDDRGRTALARITVE